MKKKIAASAIRAGVHLYLKTKIVNLIWKEGKVEGVETSSSRIPKATGEIIICADGIKSAGHGFAAREELCEPANVRPGISYLLANADVAAGVIEHFLSPDPLLNYKTFFTHGNGLSILGFPSYAAFDELKERADNAVSRKIKNAHALEVSGFSRTSSGKYAQHFKNMVKGNVLFVGDASGGAGNIHGMIQGQFAATVAASAIKEHDTRQKDSPNTRMGCSGRWERPRFSIFPQEKISDRSTSGSVKSRRQQKGSGRQNWNKLGEKGSTSFSTGFDLPEQIT